MAGPRRGDCTGRALPRYDCRIARNAALKNLIPTDHPASVRGEEFADARHEPALQRVFAGDSESPHLRLDSRRGFPLVLHRLVAADMDVTRWEQRHCFGEDVLQK